MVVEPVFNISRLRNSACQKKLTPIRHVATPWCTQIECRKIVAVCEKTGQK
jgi:hypothetical protein